MTLIIAFSLCFFVVSFFSTIHAIGLWCLLLITHGIIFSVLGSSASHLPLYAGLAVCAAILLRRQWHGVSPKIWLVFLCMMVVMGIAAAQGFDQGHSVLTIMMYAKGFLLALLLAGCVRREIEIKTMTLYCLVGLTIGALATIYQYYTGTFTISTIYTQRAASLRGDPNDTAMLLVMGIPLSVYWLTHAKKGVPRAAFFCSLALLLTGLVLTSSRGGLVTLLAVALILYLKKPTIRVAVICILIGITLVTFAPKSYWQRMESMVTGEEQHGSKSISNRVLLQKRGVAMLFERPALGVGPGNFGLAYAVKYENPGLLVHRGRGLSETYIQNFGVAHNMHLEFFVENGLLGGVFIIMVFVLALKASIDYDRKAALKKKEYGLGFTVAVTISSMLVAGLFLSQGKNSVLWFMVGLGLAMSRIAETVPLRLDKPNLIMRSECK